MSATTAPAAENSGIMSFFGFGKNSASGVGPGKYEKNATTTPAGPGEYEKATMMNPAEAAQAGGRRKNKNKTRKNKNKKKGRKNKSRKNKGRK